MTPNLTFVYDRRCQASKTRQAAVELRITANRERKYISTGIKLYPKEWKIKTTHIADEYEPILQNI
jgi:hypothetical protein